MAEKLGQNDRFPDATGEHAAETKTVAGATGIAGSASLPPVGPMRWDGWGQPELARKLPFAVRALLPVKLGRTPQPLKSMPLGTVKVPDPLLTAEDRASLAAIVGDAQLALDAETRLRHAGGKSTPDLLHRRAPSQQVPDGVVSPAGHAEVLAVLQTASERGIAVIPFGGGTSVVAALDPERGSHHAVIALELRRLSGLVHLDEISGEARFLAGTTGPDAERALLEHGFELGHFPQSFLYATLGGFAAARSSGQNSAGHGRFESMVLGMRVATPTGEMSFGVAPGTSVGPDLGTLFLGSEGIFGVITELTLRVHRSPETRAFEAWTFPDFHSGAAALREVAQRLPGASGPTVIRLSDETETSVSLAQHGQIGKALAQGCSAIAVFEGDAESVRARQRRTAQLVAGAGGASVGSEPAESWLRGRFGAPYLRDALLDHGVLCETLETATSWSQLERLKQAVGKRIETAFGSRGAKSLVLCHVSHVYPSGAALYFTILAGVKGDLLQVWGEVKAEITDTIVAEGGTVSHHHGVGREHAPWLEREIGAGGIRLLQAVKRELDPAGIMNPGALIPATAPSTSHGARPAETRGD